MASAMLISSNVSATNNIQRLPSVTVQADSSVAKKASKFFLEGKLFGIQKKGILLTATVGAIIFIYKAKTAKKTAKTNGQKHLGHFVINNATNH